MSMGMLAGRDLDFARCLAELGYANPFLDRRISLEQQALGDAYVDRGRAWNLRPEDEAEDPNVDALCRLANNLLTRLGRAPDAGEQRQLVEDVALFALYHESRDELDAIIAAGDASVRVDHYDEFARRMKKLGMGDDLPHLFACLFQVRRAFVNTFRYIVGVSAPTALLRAAVWESIFTYDLRRYRRSLYTQMADYTTLITGPSGTGKELVARAIGLSRYVPFDPKTRTFADFAGSFHALNLSSLSPTLIESELFGHKAGSFTGAVADRTGWFDTCSRFGSVFLDEIGDLDEAIQVKLLRVLQSRQFSRLGETKQRRFEGKIIAATNRDVAELMRTGKMRTDFYYRLCSDVITTPSLRQQIDDEPGELHELIRHIAARIVGDEADSVAEQVEAWIDEHLGADYAWPGNVRELEQCVRNVLIRRSYEPPRVDADRSLADAIHAGQMSADELLCRYCRLVYERCGSYEQAARVLGLDRRTVKAKVTSPLPTDVPTSSAGPPAALKADRGISKAGDSKRSAGR